VDRYRRIGTRLFISARVQLGIPDPRRTNRLLTALATRLTLIHEEGGIGRCPRVLTDER
jgi:hypothetical protein